MKLLGYVSCFKKIAMILLLHGAAAQVWAHSTTITVLHTNDIHGHLTPWIGWEGALSGRQIGGLDRMATAIKMVRREVGSAHTLLLDAGDTLGDSMIADETQGKAVIDAMNQMGYTAMVIGNHEPDFTAQILRARIRDAKFPIIAANIIDQASGALFTQPYVIKQVQGIKIGILGLAYPNTPLTTVKKNILGLTYLKAPEVARDYLPKMRQAGAQLIIVLSHYGLSADKKLAQQVPGIDVIVGGHSHNRMTQALTENGTLIVQAGAHGSDVGRLDLTLEQGKIVGSTHRLLTIDSQHYAPDPAVARVIKKALTRHRATLTEAVGEAAGLIQRAQTLAGQEARKRDLESPADSLFADMIQEATQADVVFLPGIGYGTAILAGRISAADLRNLIPHHSKIITMTLSGQQISDILEQSLENTYTEDTDKKVGGLVQVGGLRFKYRAVAAFGQRLTEVWVGAAPLDAQRTYRVATNALLAEGGHRYRTFLDGKNPQEISSQYALIKAAFKKRATVEAPQPSRITRIDP